MFEYQCQKTNFGKKLVFRPTKSSRLSDSHAFFASLFYVKKYKTERIVKCHPYLWLAPHLLLPLAPCLNPQSACYIYIVMRAPLLTKHFLFDCTHKKKSLQIALANSSGKFQQIFLACSSLDSWWCRLYYSTSNLKDFSSLLSPSHCRCFCLCPFVFFFPFSWSLSRF